jgi:predicted metalloprotease with PDZ domain
MVTSTRPRAALILFPMSNRYRRVRYRRSGPNRIAATSCRGALALRCRVNRWYGRSGNEVGPDRGFVQWLSAAADEGGDTPMRFRLTLG